MIYNAEVLIPKQSLLGEGVIWDESRKCIHYVDITGNKIHSYHCIAASFSSVSTGQSVGCIALDEDCNLIAMLKNSIAKVDLDIGAIVPLLQLDIADYLRFNDGKCDCKGRIWVGTMAADSSDKRAPHAGTLYKIENGTNYYPMLNRLTISNGIVWNADNTAMYHIDTATQQIAYFDFDADTGKIGSKRIAFTVPCSDGAPDGMTIDRQGMLWVALWGGYKVCRYNPENGQKLDEINVPAKNVSCCTFGGDEMNELFITTAMDQENNGGEVYHVKTNTTGFAPYKFKGVN